MRSWAGRAGLWLLTGMMMSGLVRSACGQQKLPAPTGTVTGHVTFAATRQPARLVELTLVKKPDAAELAQDWGQRPKVEPGVDSPVATIGGRSQLDGSFTIPEVPPGDYYVIAHMTGYVVPVAQITSADKAKDLDTIMREIVQVHVEAYKTASAEVSLRKGGAIGGRVQFEDGTPVVGVYVRPEPATGDDMVYALRPSYMQQAVGFRLQVGAQTDAEGRFLIVGLKPGRYVVSTAVQTSGGMRMGADGQYKNGNSDNVWLSVYQPAGFHKKDAKIFEIKTDERFDGADIELELSGLHTLRGRILAKEDRHAFAKCYVVLRDPADENFFRYPVLQADGSFEVKNVPAGTYTLDVQGAADLEGTKVIRQFDGAKVPVLVVDGDVGLGDVLLEQAKAAESSMKQ